MPRWPMIFGFGGLIRWKEGIYATEKTAPAPSGGRSRRENPKPELQSRLQTPFSTQENDQETMRNPHPQRKQQVLLLNLASERTPHLGSPTASSRNMKRCKGDMPLFRVSLRHDVRSGWSSSGLLACTSMAWSMDSMVNSLNPSSR